MANNSSISIHQHVLWLAICIYHEARGEPKEGQIAVAHVIMNRVRERDKSVEQIVLQPFQFSWANNNRRPPIKNYAALSECLDSAMVCLSERMQGVDFDGANHYFADSIRPPVWASKMRKIGKIGAHVFYRG